MHKYDIDFFIALYTEHDEDYFSLSTSDTPIDAYQWLTSEQQRNVVAIVKDYGSLRKANDGALGYEIFGQTIKQRVVNFLTYVKERRLSA